MAYNENENYETARIAGHLASSQRRRDLCMIDGGSSKHDQSGKILANLLDALVHVIIVL